MLHTHSLSASLNGVITCAPIWDCLETIPRPPWSSPMGERGVTYNSREWSNVPRTTTRRYSKSFRSSRLKEIQWYMCGGCQKMSKLYLKKNPMCGHEILWNVTHGCISIETIQHVTCVKGNSLALERCGSNLTCNNFTSVISELIL